MDQFQTPEVRDEENWWKLSQLAYIQLFLSRNLAKALLYPWEGYLEHFKARDPQLGPAPVQRSFHLILDQIDTPAKPPQVCKPGKGRQKGDMFPKRPRSEIIFKNRLTEKQAQSLKKIQNEPLLSFRKKVKNLKTLKFANFVEVVKDMISELGITEDEFVQKLRISQQI